MEEITGIVSSSVQNVSGIIAFAKGDKGDPGSDASVTSENIAAALGYTPADADDVSRLEKEYELIEKTTLAEAVETYTVTLTADKRYRHIIVSIDGTASGTLGNGMKEANFLISRNGSNLSSIRTYYGSKRMSIIECHIDGVGTAKSWNSASAYGNNTSTNIAMRPGDLDLFQQKDAYISKIILNAPMLEGACVRIVGSER